MPPPEAALLPDIVLLLTTVTPENVPIPPATLLPAELFAIVELVNVAVPERTITPPTPPNPKFPDTVLFVIVNKPWLLAIPAPPPTKPVQRLPEMVLSRIVSVAKLLM